MERRTQNRTPKRLLSVFLSILMVLSSFVFVNPTVSKAATSITHKALYSSKKFTLVHVYSSTGDEVSGTFTADNVEATPDGDFYRGSLLCFMWIL